MWDLIPLRLTETRIRVARGEKRAAAGAGRWLTDAWSQGGLAWEDGTLCLASAAVVAADAQDCERARSLLRECLEVPGVRGSYLLIQLLTQVVRAALGCGDVRLARALAGGFEACNALSACELTSAGALIAEAEGDAPAAAGGFADAATGWHEFGAPYEEAHALLGQGRCLAVLGRAPEAAAPLAAAREIFARLGARPALAETSELLSRLAGSDGAAGFDVGRHGPVG